MQASGGAVLIVSFTDVICSLGKNTALWNEHIKAKIAENPITTLLLANWNQTLSVYQCRVTTEINPFFFFFCFV